MNSPSNPPVDEIKLELYKRLSYEYLKKIRHNKNMRRLNKDLKYLAASSDTYVQEICQLAGPVRNQFRVYGISSSSQYAFKVSEQLASALTEALNFLGNPSPYITGICTISDSSGPIGIGIHYTLRENCRTEIAAILRRIACAA